MNRPQAKLSEILGHNRECIYKARFRYDPCRSCDYSKPCENFTPMPDNSLSKVLRPFYWYHSSITRPLRPKVNEGVIRRASDGGVV